MRQTPSLHAFIDALHWYYELLRLPVCHRASSGFIHCYALPALAREHTGSPRYPWYISVKLAPFSDPDKTSPTSPFTVSSCCLLPHEGYRLLFVGYHEALLRGSLALRPTLKLGVSAFAPRNWIMAGG